MKSKKNRVVKKEGAKIQHESRSPSRIESQKDGDEYPIRKAPDVDRHVDEIVKKYNDFGIIDRE